MPNRGGPKILAIVLAGGEGKRLMPLTADRAKPAVPFGGIYRLIDFALSNLVNSNYLHIVVLTQYKSHSLDRHITTTWRMSSLLGNYVTPVPAQQRVGKNWYLGSADAIFQSLNTIHDERPDIVAITAAMAGPTGLAAFGERFPDRMFDVGIAEQQPLEANHRTVEQPHRQGGGDADKHGDKQAAQQGAIVVQVDQSFHAWAAS